MKNPLLYLSALAAVGGGERDRTDDLLVANQALSQLSYTPKGIHILLCIGAQESSPTLRNPLPTPVSRGGPR